MPDFRSCSRRGRPAAASTCPRAIGSPIRKNWVNYFARRPVDLLKIVPSFLSALLEDDPAGRILPKRLLILGGEASSWELVQSHFEPGSRASDSESLRPDRDDDRSDDVRRAARAASASFANAPDRTAHGRLPCLCARRIRTAGSSRGSRRALLRWRPGWRGATSAVRA